MTEIGRPPTPPPPPPPPPAQAKGAKDNAPARKAEKAAPARKGGGAQKAEASAQKAEVNSDGFSRGGVGGTSGIATTTQSGPHAMLRFGHGPEGVLDGQLRQTGRVTLEYALSRVTITDAAKAFPGGFGVSAFIRFGPRTDVLERPCVAFAFVRGQPGPARPSPITLEVPAYAQSLEVWFRHWVGTGPQAREFLDGSSQKPHAFPVKPVAAPPSRG